MREKLKRKWRVSVDTCLRSGCSSPVLRPFSHIGPSWWLLEEWVSAVEVSLNTLLWPMSCQCLLKSHRELDHSCLYRDLCMYMYVEHYVPTYMCTYLESFYCDWIYENDCKFNLFYSLSWYLLLLIIASFPFFPPFLPSSSLLFLPFLHYHFLLPFVLSHTFSSYILASSEEDMQCHP